MLIGGDRVYFGTVGIATNVLDFHTNTYRQVVCDDLRDIIRLSDVLDPPDFILIPGTPTDVPPGVVDMVEFKYSLDEYEETFYRGSTEPKEPEKEVLPWRWRSRGALKNLQRRPFFSILVCLTSPLLLRDDADRVDR